MGTVYRIGRDGNESVLYSFGSTSADGVLPEGGLLRTQGALYGAATGGGSHGGGTVFKLSSSILFNFDDVGADGRGPSGVLNEDAKGDFYDTARGAGIGENGVVFKLSTAQRRWERLSALLCSSKIDRRTPRDIPAHDVAYH